MPLLAQPAMVPKRCLQRPAVAGLSADMAIVAGQKPAVAGLSNVRRAARAGGARTRRERSEKVAVRERGSWEKTATPKG